LEESPENKSLLNTANSSGFLLQVAISADVEAGSKKHGWKVEAEEYPYSTRGGQKGFADLILSKGNMRVVIEAKRYRNDSGEVSWVFFAPDQKVQTSQTKIFWAAQYKADKSNYYRAGITNYSCAPQSFASNYCALLGQDKSRPTLERISSEMTRAVDGLYIDEFKFNVTSPDGFKDQLRFYLPILVTTAKLYVCKFSPEDISLETGDLSQPEFEKVPWIRFNKSLPSEHIEQAHSLRDFAILNERTTFVVEATSLNDFLSKLNIDLSKMPAPPWTSGKKKEIYFQ